jgi:hypothetical protein
MAPVQIEALGIGVEFQDLAIYPANIWKGRERQAEGYPGQRRRPWVGQVGRRRWARAVRTRSVIWASGMAKWE